MEDRPQQLREEGDDDLSKIVRAIGAKGSDAFFEWQDGTLAYTLTELASQSDKKVDECKTYLFNKSFETRLQQLGKAPLATAVSAVRTKYKNTPTHAVEMFIREICKAAKMNPYPILAVQDTAAFGKVIFGETQAKTIQIDNRGRGYAWGTMRIKESPPQLTIPATFDLDEKHLSFQIKLDTSGLAVGQYLTQLIIESEGLPEPSCVSISYEVASLNVSVQPTTINMGSIGVGGTAKSSTTINNNGRGRSSATARLEPEIPGVTFPKKFVVDGKLQLNVELDALSVSPRKYAANLIIEGAGFSHPLQVPLLFEVTALTVKFEPPVLKLGKIPHGTKNITKLKVSWMPEGGRLVCTARKFEPSVVGLSAKGQLEGQESELEISVDTSKLQPGKRFKTKLLLQTNVNTLEVPIEFKTSHKPNYVVAGRTLAFGVGAGIVMYVCRALLATVENLNPWIVTYESDVTSIIGAGAFGALVVVATVVTFRHSRFVSALRSRLASGTAKTRELAADLQHVDDMTNLGLDKHKRPAKSKTAGVK